MRTALVSVPSQVAEEFDPFAAGTVERVYPTSEAQREVWLADQLGLQASLAFNESVNLHLHGHLDSNALSGALNALVARHESLRATCGPDGMELVVNAQATVELPRFDWRQLDAQTRSEALGKATTRAVETPFNLESGPLFRGELYRLADDWHVLLMTAHHIVCDGWSWGLIAEDIRDLYAEQVGGGPALEPAPAYADYVAWEVAESAADAHSEHQRYWLSRFADGSLPVLDLPTDRPRAPMRNFSSRRVDHQLGARLVDDVRKLGARSGVSFFAAMFSGFAATLGRLTGQDDLVIGVPAAGQAASGMTRLVGHCVNLLPIRVHVEADRGFDDFLRHAGSIILDAFEHQTLTYGSLLKKLPLRRDSSRLPLVSVMFNLDQAIKTDASANGALRLTLEANPRHFENFELFVNAVPVDGGLRLECQYNTALFDSQTVVRWLAAFEALLQSAVAQPSTEVGALNWLAAGELAALRELQPRPSTVNAADLMQTAFVRQAAASPTRTALRWADTCLTYADLEHRSNRIARALRARGLGRGHRVGLCLGRGMDMVVSMLGVLKAGAAYVPLDPAFPPARLNYYAEDAGLALLITESGAVSAPTSWCADSTSRVVRLDIDLDWLDQPGDPLPVGPLDATPDDAAYVIYTSGSTGKPKGVCVPHRAVVNFLSSMGRLPGIGTDDRLAAVTTLSFDIAVLELMLPLTVGAEVVIVPREVAVDGVLLRDLLEATHTTIMQATPGTWRMLLDASWTGTPHFKALVGGESFPLDLSQSLLDRCGEVWNLYGPTETTVWSTAWRVRGDDASQSSVPIGRPIDNTTVWILDGRLQPAPVGVPGEICIGGLGVALGYLDRPDLTADRFVEDRHGGRSDAVLYRTGDRGRWRNDGTLEHLGRMDFQVKVRGYRIELGEIEACCNEWAGVAQTVVVAREHAPGDVRLIAYLRLEQGANFDEALLRAHLCSRLPAYMVPQRIQVLDAIPLLPNGKIDRQGLQGLDLQPVAQPARVGPRDEVEHMVATAMEHALSLPGMGIHDDFFALGGHSLLAARVATTLSQSFGRRVPLRAVFDAPTIAQLSSWLKDHAEVDGSVSRRIEALPVRTGAPASLMQQRLWFLEQLDPGRLTYNTPSAHRLLGPMNLSALERAFEEMVRRQAVLRTSIRDEAGTPVQHIQPSLEVSLRPVTDLSPLPSAEQEDTLAKLLAERVSQPIDMREAPLFRIGLYKLAEEEHVLFFMPHHVIWDGWSFDLFYGEMASLYEAYSEGSEPTLVPLSVSYADFATWQQGWLESEDLRRQLAHWKQRLSDLPEPLALPLDRTRPARMTGNGATEPISCTGELTERLRRFGQAHDATLFMSLLAVYALLLSRLSGQRDIVIGTPVRGRDSEQLEGVMGFFVNALPLRLRIDPQQGFLELLAQVRAVALDAFSSPDVPFELLVRQMDLVRDESRSPIYQAFFSFQDARQRRRQWGALRQEQIHVFQPGAAEDLGLWFLEHRDGLAGGLSYNSDVILAKSATRLGERFVCLLQAVLDEPTRATGLLDYAPAAELELLRQWNRTASEHVVRVSVGSMVQSRATQMPTHLALRSGTSLLTYAELDARSNRLARELRARGVARGMLVGLCLNRSADMLVAQLAILRSGAAYVPLDPAYPSERLAYMANDAQLALLVTESSLRHVLDWPRERSVLVDTDAAQIAARADGPLPTDTDLDARPEDPAYVIYTSGSTGRPKGVVVPHGAVINFLCSMTREPGLVATDRLLAVTTLSFDIAVLELLLPLTVGAQVVLASREQVLDGRALLELLNTSGATVMQATPSLWRMLIDAGWQGAPGFKALVGGEALPPDLAQLLRARCAAVWNMYGPTETTVWSTCWKLDDLQQGIAIGRPIANTTVWVLDEQRQLCPIGVHGEICIGGDGVSSGYLRRPELTAERFIPDPFKPGALLYRTGDRGRWRDDGLLEHLGRLDFQVKLRGHRIELGEIEAAMSSHPGVTQCVAIVREDTPGDARLVAYVVPRGDAPSSTELRQHLQTRLPEYMLPQHVLALPTLPLLPNGKIDRKALPVPSAQPTPDMPDRQASLSETEQAVADIWQELLGIDGIRPEDNFFDLGGHSLLAMRLAVAMERQLGMRVEVRRFIFESLAQIAATPRQVSTIPDEAPATRPGLVSRVLGRLSRRP